MSTFHDNNSGVACLCGELLPAQGGGFTFVPNKQHEYLNTIRFENPNKEKVLQYLKDNIRTTSNEQRAVSNETTDINLKHHEYRDKRYNTKL